MVLLDVSFGIFAFMPLGWLFMIFVIVLECLAMTRSLLPKWLNKRIYGVTVLSNVVSGAIGIFLSIYLNGGWYLVVWFPWVSSHEIDLPADLHFLATYYIIAFILTIIVEVNINVLLLRKHYTVKKVTIATLISNLISYAVGTAVLYSYSFHQ